MLRAAGACLVLAILVGAFAGDREPWTSIAGFLLIVALVLLAVGLVVRFNARR
jgi:hypothetical protein